MGTQENTKAQERGKGLAPFPHLMVAGLAVLCCLLWGSAFPSIKIGYRLFDIASVDVGSQMLFAGTRFALAGVGVIVAMSLAHGRPLVPARRDWGVVALMSVFQTSLQYLLFYVGLAHATGVSSSVIEGSNPFLCILLGALVFRQERLTGRKVVGCVLGFAGVALVTLAGAATGDAAFALDGEGAILLSAISAALSTCLIRIFSRSHDPVMVSGWQFVLGGATLAAVGLALGGRLEPSGAAAWGLLAYLAFVSAAAYTLWSVLLAHNPISQVSVYGFANPVFGVILSALLLGETDVVSPLRCVASLALIALGVVVVNRAPAEARTHAKGYPS